VSSAGSSVVSLRWVDDAIAVVGIEDREAKNFFSDAIARDYPAAFERIAGNPAARAVVVHGYDTYFSCGGTRDALVAISENRLKYTDFTYFDLLRRCELPTIAAMQGHAIGGGLALGLHADFHFFAEEAVYSANFMNYGFTPGMGSTFTLPRVVGEQLGWEMLFSGGNYRGADLRRRGALAPVLPRAQVVDAAIALARQFAGRPVVSLKELKRRRLQTTAEALATAIRRELEMHRVTFPLPEVRRRINEFRHD